MHQVIMAIAVTESERSKRMSRYIDADAMKADLDTIHMTDDWGFDVYRQALKDYIDKQPTADVVEVKHGRWHFLSEDPYDETGVPTEAGLYRVIDFEGKEYTDKYFGKPTLTKDGASYWRDSRQQIRAWARMDGEEE